MSTTKLFSRFASGVARATGKPATFVVCVLTIFVWALCGPLFHFSDTWQLVINTGTTIFTFLQVFLIQNTQNRDSAAIQAKLDELIRASAAHNKFIGVEDLTEEELERLRSQGGDRAERVARAEAAALAAEAAVGRANKQADKAAADARPSIR